MASLLTLALILIPAYLVGSIPFGLIVGRLKGIDIRQHGSGNIGATNVWRTLGPKWGGTTFLLDAGKGFLAVRLASELAMARVTLPVPDDYLAYAEAFAGLACIIGHSFPVWLRFSGGKGVATSLGVILSIMPPIASLIVLVVWVLVFAISRYVSLASIAAAVSLPATMAILYYNQWRSSHSGIRISVIDAPNSISGIDSPVTLAFASAAAFLVIRRHRDNIKRLIAGTENRFGKKKN
ncbi:MAG: glycerol-3-phosphate 1-O-acyltransferase PlsY [Verrucomicrobiota bacterium]